MSNRNRQKGHDAEKRWIKWLAEALNLRWRGPEWQILSSREGSKATDDAGVDILMNPDNIEDSLVSSFRVQIKRTLVNKNKDGSVKIDISSLHRIKLNGLKLLFSTVYVRNGKVNKHYNDLVIMSKEDFITILKHNYVSKCK